MADQPSAPLRDRPLSARKGITDAQLIAALKSSAGIFGVAAEKLGCSRSNVAERVGKSPTLQEACRQIDQTIIDLAEANVIDGLQEKQPGSTKATKEAKAMSKWFLDRKAKDRGYRTGMDLTNPDGTPLQLAAAPTVVINVHYVQPGPQEDVV